MDITPSHHLPTFDFQKCPTLDEILCGHPNLIQLLTMQLWTKDWKENRIPFSWREEEMKRGKEISQKWVSKSTTSPISPLLPTKIKPLQRVRGTRDKQRGLWESQTTYLLLWSQGAQENSHPGRKLHTNLVWPAEQDRIVAWSFLSSLPLTDTILGRRKKERREIPDGVFDLFNQKRQN